MVCPAVSQLLEAEGLESVKMLSFSGGSPYVLVCAQKLASRVLGVCLVSPMAPLALGKHHHAHTFAQRMEFRLFGLLPLGLISALLSHLHRRLQKNPAKTFNSMAKRATANERKIILKPNFQ